MAAVSHLLSVCIAASPGKGDIGLPATRPEFLPKTLPVLVVRWPGSSPHRFPPRRDCCALASMLPTGRHFCRPGRTAHGSVVSCSAWHTHIACVGVLVLFLWGCWPLLACPRTYLRPSMIKAGPLPSSALCCTPSSVLRTPRTPSRLRSLSAVQPYTFGLGLTRLPGRVSPVPRCSFPTCRRPLPRRGPSSIPVRDDVCCLRRDMSGSALSNTFRLIICRGCSVHFMLRPAGSLPSVARAFDTPLGPVGSLLPAGVCYRALWRLPRQDFHLLEQRVFQDAPCGAL